MSYIFPGAVPEVPVSDMDRALEYYQHKFGFSVDWAGTAEDRRNLTGPLENISHWLGNGANVLHPPESKSWPRLHESVAAAPMYRATPVPNELWE
jgi:hypothetical protein